MDDNAELESFRRKWREEVSQRNRALDTHSPTDQPVVVSSGNQRRVSPTRLETSSRLEEEFDDGNNSAFDVIVQQTQQLSLHIAEDAQHQNSPSRKLYSALEHFEKAVEKEAEGQLGDSLSHYRLAYRLDSSVDQTYRKKHFAISTKVQNTWPHNASAVSVPSAATDAEDDKPLSTAELIASFANLVIPRAEPIIANTPLPPCPISQISTDVLVEILRHVSLVDPAAFSRMALVCKRLAYHIAHEQHIWKGICQDPKFGFAGMYYDFGCEVTGERLHTLAPRYTLFPRGAPVQIPQPLSSWSQMFQAFPRIRFTGIYISTVNYTRPGASSGYSGVSWNTPIRIVTYYRYLRFYPDGSVVSLLTTTEPTDVVPHISRENMLTARAHSHQGPSQHQHQRHRSETIPSSTTTTNPIPPVAMSTLKYALRGRWRLIHPTPASPTSDNNVNFQTDQPSPPKASPASLMKQDSISAPDPRNLVIETEGVDPKYIYTMYLSLRSSNTVRNGNSTSPQANTSKNTRLIWRSYWSYNKLTDDWAEFGLRNDRSFVFRRVRGWGMD